ncbi:hypothetical protein IAU60_002488 [Kwoniella sp. DSM 27419]
MLHSRDSSSRSTLRPGTANGVIEGSMTPHDVGSTGTGRMVSATPTYVSVRVHPYSLAAGRDKAHESNRDHDQGRDQASLHLPTSTSHTARAKPNGRLVHPPPQRLSIPSGVRKAPPPPPASSPDGPGHGVGYQTDYSRVATGVDSVRRPESNVGSHSRRVQAPVQTHAASLDLNKRRPAEAYTILRHHRVPKSAWTDGLTRETDDWTYELRLLQQPTRGKALGLQQLPRGWPALSAPLIVQLIVTDARARPITPDDPHLTKRLVHTSMMVDLVSSDGSEYRSTMRLQAGQGLIPSTSASADAQQRNLLGSLHRCATVHTMDDQRGFFFLFTDLVVRNVGIYALDVKLLDLAGPAHLGTSIGVTGTLATALTEPFVVYHASQFPGALGVTELSMLFSAQGERNLGRRTRESVRDSSDEGSFSPETVGSAVRRLRAPSGSSGGDHRSSPAMGPERSRL